MYVYKLMESYEGKLVNSGLIWFEGFIVELLWLVVFLEYANEFFFVLCEQKLPQWNLEFVRGPLIRWRFDRFLIWTKLVLMCDLWKGGLRWLLGGGDGPFLSTGMFR